MDWKAKKTEATKSEIKKAAARLFFERGFREVTMADIGNEVGLSPGSLYYYYPTKEDILKELENECTKRFKSFIANFQPVEGSLIDTVVALLEDVFLFARENKDYFLFMTRFVSSVQPSLLDEIRKNRIEAFTKARVHIANVLKEFQEDGLARKDISPETLAHVITGLIHSLMFEWFLGMIKDREMPLRIRVLADLFVNGAGVNK